MAAQQVGVALSATKRCFKCGSEKPLSAFYRHPRMADGRLNKCKECTKRDVKQRYRRKMGDPEWHQSERRRGRTKYHRLYAPGTVWVSPSAPKNQKKNASTILLRAVRDGTVKRPDTCTVCGKAGRIEGHHADYSRPLEVEWLCPKCHRTRHYTKKKAATKVAA